MNISVAEQYKFIGLQMAAEANLVEPDGLPLSGELLISALVRNRVLAAHFHKFEMVQIYFGISYIFYVNCINNIIEL